MNVIARLVFKLMYYNSAIHRFNHYSTKTPPPPKKLMMLLGLIGMKYNDIVIWITYSYFLNAFFDQQHISTHSARQNWPLLYLTFSRHNSQIWSASHLLVYNQLEEYQLVSGGCPSHKILIEYRALVPLPCQWQCFNFNSK